jgi:hypothetical protein
MKHTLLAVFTALCLFAVLPARAQNPVQWSGNVSQSVERAREQGLPLLFWVSDGVDRGDDDGLRDSQEDSFRDRTVVAIIHKHFVPVRVSRNSRVLDEAQKLGLPTSFGLYAAVLTSDGKVLGEIGPGEIADPGVFAQRLVTIFTAYRDGLYQQVLSAEIENAEADKAKARRAAQTVWRLGILSADKGIIALTDRKDLTETERSRLCSLLASLATQPCIDFLLDKAAAGEKPAAAALRKAEPAALEWLLPEMPGESGEVSPRQLAAFQAAAAICKMPGRDAIWWTMDPPPDRAGELARIATKARRVLEYWNETEGWWR